MSSTINILFLGGSKRVSVAEHFIKAAEKKKIKVNVFSYELDKNEPIAHIGTIIPGLKWADKNIDKDLEKVIKKHNIHIVLPFVDIASVICNRLRHQIKHVHFCTSPESITKTMFNKSMANTWFIKNNIPVPTTNFKPPLIAKPTTGSGAKGTHILKNAKELAFFLKHRERANYFMQKFIEGIEYTVDCYIEQTGKIISIVPRKRLEVVNGEVIKSVTEKNNKIIDMSKEIISKGKLTGPINIQFIRENTTGKVLLMEINTRIGSGVLTSIEAGADVCTFIINEYLKIPNVYTNSWKENLLMVRSYREFYFLCN